VRKAYIPGGAGCGWLQLWGVVLYGASTVKVTVRLDGSCRKVGGVDGHLE